MNSQLPFEVIAAVRFLREGLIQTLLIIVGVSVGVGVIVFMSALLAGLQANIVNRVLSTQASIVVLPRKEVARPVLQDGQLKVIGVVQNRAQRKLTIDQWQKLRDALAANREVNVVSPTASGSAFITRGAATRAVSLLGIIPERYYRFVDIPDDLVSGTSRINSNDVLVGKDLADDLGVHTGDKLHFTTPSGGDDLLKIAGVFDLGNKGFNQRNCIVTLATAQGLLSMTGGISSIDVTLKDPYAANEIASAFSEAHPVEVDSWIKTNAQFFTAIHTQNISTAVIRSSVALSVALGIASVLAVSVVQRSKEIGILRAMGASQGQIMRLFLVQGGIVGLLGSLIGSALAWMVLKIWLLYARNPDGTPFFTIEISVTLYILTAVLATLSGVLAAAVPARRASRLDPVEAIRG